MAKKARSLGAAAADDQFSNTVSEDDDDNVVVDLSSVEALKFEAIPGGKYPGVVISQEYKRSKNANAPMWELRVAVDDDNSPYHNRKMWYYVSFSEKALPGTKLLISNLAPQLLEAPLNPKKAAEEAVLVGIPVILDVAVELYEGQKRNRVKSLRPRQASNEFLG